MDGGGTEIAFPPKAMLIVFISPAGQIRIAKNNAGHNITYHNPCN